MHPAIIKGHTHRFTAPEGRPEVVTLFVREDNEDGLPMLRSAWEAEQAEVGMLLAGAKLHLGMSVPIHPVVNLMVADLPDDFDPVFTARSFHCSKRGKVVRVEAFVPRPPHGLRIWVEQPIVAGFAAAFAASVAEIEKQARATRGQGFDGYRDVWAIDKPRTSETGHSTQKPVECMKRPIENNSKRGDTVYEPFAGSSTTVIACELTGRRCLAIELSPVYVDMGVMRWQNMTGKEATLVGDGRTFAEVAAERGVEVPARKIPADPADSPLVSLPDSEPLAIVS